MTDQERLTQAQDALHNLLIGAAFVEVRDADGQMVRFKAADAAQLRIYIEALKRQIGAVAPMRPMRVIG